MAIKANELDLRLSGGASNINPASSLGGIISTHDVVAEAIVNNLFDSVSSAEATAGSTEYRCYYVKNTSTSTWFSSEVWIQQDTSSATTNIDIGLDPAGAGDGVSTGVATTIVNETTAPAGVVFTHPTSSPGLNIGTLTAGQCQAIWVKRVVNAGTALTLRDTAILRHSGSDV